MRIIKTEISIPDKRFINREMPVAPPSRKPFGSRKPFSPTVAEAMPAVIKKIFQTVRERKSLDALGLDASGFGCVNSFVAH